jgi:hypothetical protein
MAFEKSHHPIKPENKALFIWPIYNTARKIRRLPPELPCNPIPPTLKEKPVFESSL